MKATFVRGDEDFDANELVERIIDTSSDTTRIGIDRRFTDSAFVAERIGTAFHERHGGPWLLASLSCCFEPEIAPGLVIFDCGCAQSPSGLAMRERWPEAKFVALVAPGEEVAEIEVFQSAGTEAEPAAAANDPIRQKVRVGTKPVFYPASAAQRSYMRLIGYDDKTIASAGRDEASKLIEAKVGWSPRPSKKEQKRRRKAQARRRAS